MSLYRSVRAVTEASGDGPIDWSAVTDAARAATESGDLAVPAAERAAFADDVRDARDRVRTVTAIDFDLPETVEIQDRHHWIDANVATFERVMAPLEAQAEFVPGVARVLNTGSMAIALSFLADNVLGQYDPLLLADGSPSGGDEPGDDREHKLYFVRPNIRRVAADLDVDYPRFRRWIAFHEVAHAAEFGAAPWLPEHLETTMIDAVETLSEGTLSRDSFAELDTAMTAVEGYAELVMDRAFDGEFVDLRRKLDERRQGRGPLQSLVRRLLGLGMKRRQYERGKAFFDAVVAATDVETAGRVWESPETLPTDAELDDPEAWLARVA